jgi:tetratricopeptide (TPR) repeat protein
MLHSVRGDWEAAAGDFAKSREVHRSIPNPYGVLLQTYRLGEAKTRLGELAEAERLLAEAHEQAETDGRERLTARTGFALGHVLRPLGRTEEARRLYQESLDAARARGADSDEARVLDAFAELAAEEGHAEEAEQHRAAARAIRQRQGLD